MAFEKRIYKKGEIYLINFEPSIGSEIQKTRPGIIIQSGDIDSELITVIPISSKIQSKDDDDILIKKNIKNRLFSDSIIKVKQISSFDKRRLIHFIGNIDNKILNSINTYLQRHFDL